MKLNKLIYKEPKLVLLFLITLISAIVFRIYAYFDRIYFFADSTLFVQAAFFAFKNIKIPQIGPFAQAPFFTGPWWLWILEILFIVPLGILTPWYIMTFFSLISIVLIYFVGKEIGGKWLGALSAFFAAISTTQIDNSFMTWNAAADLILGLIAVFFTLQFYKTKKPNFTFF